MTDPIAPPPITPTEPAPPSLAAPLPLGERAAALGHEAEAAAERLTGHPAVQAAADTASRAWGLVVLAIGLWFLADVTLQLDMPRLAWGELWPLILIALGAVIVIRGLGRRR